jgi:hypothetical protein
MNTIGFLNALGSDLRLLVARDEPQSYFCRIHALLASLCRPSWTSPSRWQSQHYLQQIPRLEISEGSDSRK